MIRLGVTGTDTGIGKTVVSCAIIAALRVKVARVAAMKPVETGGTEDAERLWRATAMKYPLTLVGPVSLPDPLAPVLAARRAGTPVDLAVLDTAFAELCAGSDAIVVEGAGGLLVPITGSESFATLFGRWKLDVVVVAPNRLGTINHTLLTVRAAQDAGLHVRAVVLNDVSGRQAGLAEETNPGLLAELLPGVNVVPFGYVSGDAATAGGSPKISLTDLGFDDAA